MYDILSNATFWAVPDREAPAALTPLLFSGSQDHVARYHAGGFRSRHTTVGYNKDQLWAHNRHGRKGRSRGRPQMLLAVEDRSVASNTVAMYVRGARLACVQMLVVTAERARNSCRASCLNWAAQSHVVVCTQTAPVHCDSRRTTLRVLQGSLYVNVTGLRARICHHLSPEPCPSVPVTSLLQCTILQTLCWRVIVAPSSADGPVAAYALLCGWLALAGLQPQEEMLPQQPAPAVFLLKS